MGRRCSSCHQTFPTSSHRCAHVSPGSNALRHFIKNALGRPTENVVSRNDRTVTVELARGDVAARRDQPSRCALLLPLSFYSQSRSPVNTEGFPNPYESHSLEPERALLVWPDFFARRSSLNIHSPCRGKLAMRAGIQSYVEDRPRRLGGIEMSIIFRFLALLIATTAAGAWQEPRQVPATGNMRPTDSESLWTGRFSDCDFPVLRRDSKRVRSTWKSPAATITWCSIWFARHEHD